MADLKEVIQTPLRPAIHDVDDIPAQFTKVLGKVYGQLNFLYPRDEEILMTFLSTADLALRSTSFLDQQKENIRKWHEIIHSIYSQVPKV